MDIIKQLADIDKKARDFGFDWPDANMILDQIISECAEVKEVITEDQGSFRLQEETGDLLQASLALCFFLKLDPQTILSATIEKFKKRFELLQKIAKEQGYDNLKNQPTELLFDLWKQAKASKL